MTDEKSANYISIASGKGGVGKTLTAINLALALRRLGFRTAIFDGDLGMANVDVLLGLRPRFTINHVVEGEATLSDVLLEGPEGIMIVPGGSGVAQIANLSLTRRIALLDQLNASFADFDYVIVDSGAGLSDTVTHLNTIADDVIVVTTPEPHAMTDAYAFIKVMSEKHGVSGCHLLVNQTLSTNQGQQTTQRICEVAEKYLNISVNALGAVPFEDMLGRLVMNQSVSHEMFSHTRAGEAWFEIAKKLSAKAKKNEDRQASWENFVFPQHHGMLRI